MEDDNFTNSSSNPSIPYTPRQDERERTPQQRGEHLPHPSAPQIMTLSSIATVRRIARTMVPTMNTSTTSKGKATWCTAARRTNMTLTITI